jgi:uncharacterized membrane protein YozB (DUF420 family)
VGVSEQQNRMVTVLCEGTTCTTGVTGCDLRGVYLSFLWLDVVLARACNIIGVLRVLSLQRSNICAAHRKYVPKKNSSYADHSI